MKCYTIKPKNFPQKDKYFVRYKIVGTMSTLIYFYILNITLLITLQLKFTFGEQPALQVFLDFPRTIDDAVEKLNNGFGKLCTKKSHSYNAEEMGNEIRSCLLPVFDKFISQTWDLFFSSEFIGYVAEKVPGNPDKRIEDSWEIPVNLTKVLKGFLDGNCSTLEKMEKCFNPEQYSQTKYCLDDRGVTVTPFRYLKKIRQTLCKDQGQPIIDIFLSGIHKCRDEYYNTVHNCLRKKFVGPDNAEVAAPFDYIASKEHYNATLFCTEAEKIHLCFYKSSDVCIKYSAHITRTFRKIFKNVNHWALYKCANQATNLVRIGPSMFNFGLILFILGWFGNIF